MWSPFRDGAEGCLWETTDRSVCDSEAELAHECPWHGRAGLREARLIPLSMARFPGLGLWAVNSSMRFVFSFYWRKFPHKVLLQTIKTPSNSWELHSSACLWFPPPVYLLPSPLSNNSTSVSLSIHFILTSDPKKLCSSRAAILEIFLPGLGTALRASQDTSPWTHEMWEPSFGTWIVSTVADTHYLALNLCEILCAKLLQLWPTHLQPHGLQSTRLLCPWNSPGKNTGVGCCALLQGIFPTQGSNSYLSHLHDWQVSSLPHELLSSLKLRWVS